MLRMAGEKYAFKDEVFDYCGDKGIGTKLGARGLRSIGEAIMIDSMFDINKQKKALTVTLDYAKNHFEKAEKVIAGN